jgi:hypothetical protein
LNEPPSKAFACSFHQINRGNMFLINCKLIKLFNLGRSEYWEQFGIFFPYNIGNSMYSEKLF